MKALTHLSAGGAAGAGLTWLIGWPLGWETALVSGAIGAAVPELEYVFFRLARELRARKLGGSWLNAASTLGQERGPWHGMELLFIVGGLSGLVAWLLGVPRFGLIYCSFLAGWLSHLLLDLINGGMRPLAIMMPYRWVFFPPWGPRRVVRGGLAENLILLGSGWVWVWRMVENLLPWAERILGRLL